MRCTFTRGCHILFSPPSTSPLRFHFPLEITTYRDIPKGKKSLEPSAPEANVSTAAGSTAASSLGRVSGVRSLSRGGSLTSDDGRVPAVPTPAREPSVPTPAHEPAEPEPKRRRLTKSLSVASDPSDEGRSLEDSHYVPGFVLFLFVPLFSNVKFRVGVL